MAKLRAISDSTRLKLIDHYSSWSGKENALSKNELIRRINGDNFFNHLDLDKAEDREIKNRAWARISQGISIINRDSKLIKIDSIVFKTDEGDIRKWFSIDKVSDDEKAARKRQQKSDEFRVASERFLNHIEIIRPTIYELEEEMNEYAPTNDKKK